MTTYANLTNVVMWNIAQANLGDTLSRKHIKALVTITAIMGMRTVSINKRGIVSYTPRNTAYSVLYSIGYYYDDKRNDWYEVV